MHTQKIQSRIAKFKHADIQRVRHICSHSTHFTRDGIKGNKKDKEADMFSWAIQMSKHLQYPLTHFLSSFTLCFSFPFLHFLALNVYCIDAKYITHNCPHYEREHKEMQINILTFTLCSSTLVLKVRIRMHITYFSFKQYTVKCASYTQTHRKSNRVILHRLFSPS